LILLKIGIPNSQGEIYSKGFTLHANWYIIVRIFSIKGTKLAEISEQQFPLEKEIQGLTEANLQELFELDFVKSEFELHGLRIDTLAFDKESKGFHNRIQKRQKFLSSRSRDGLPKPYAQ
jgi:hypothetical protein